MAILIGSLGTGNYEETSYFLGERDLRTRFAPVAVAGLTEEGIERALLLVTRAAQEKWGAAVAHELERAGVATELVEVPELRRQENVFAPLAVLAERIPEESRVVLDTTYGLRHLPMAYLVSLAYLSGLRRVTVAGIWYCARDLREGERSPVLDVTDLFALLEWYQAIAQARASGDWRTAGRVLNGHVGRLFRSRAGQGDPRVLGTASNALRQLGESLALGLPLEVGLDAARAAEAVDRIANALGGAASRDHGEPFGWTPATLALAALSAETRRWAVRAGSRDKADLPLSREEVLRQIELGRWYAERHDAQKSLLVLREAVLSASLLGRPEASEWLEWDRARQPAEARLNSLRERARLGLASNSESAAASIWDRIRERRNRLAHAGMLRERVRTPPDLERLADDLRHAVEGEVFERIGPGGQGRLLLTPLGLAPGVLYSALRHVSPRSAFIVTSPEAKSGVERAVQAAGVPVETQVLEIADPWRDWQLPPRSEERIRALASDAAEVVVNVTGGTTVLQYVAERLGRSVERVGVPVRRVALVDLRSPEEQRAEPWVLGELVELEAEGSKEGSGEEEEV